MVRHCSICISIVLMLTGCESNRHFEAVTCPDVVAYSCEVQAEAATELEAGQTPTLMRLMQDYKVMRDQARACAGVPMPKPNCQPHK